MSEPSIEDVRAALSSMLFEIDKIRDIRGQLDYNVTGLTAEDAEAIEQALLQARLERLRGMLCLL
jgi:hypothetical protein